MKRWFRTAALQLSVSLAAVLLALAAGAIFIAALGKNPIEVYRTMLEGTLLYNDDMHWYGLGQVMYKATSLIFVGAAVAFSFRAGLFNIGAEGQIYAGAFFAALAGRYVVPEGATWGPLACMAAALVGGALAAAVPAILKSTRGVHEVIVTIMMNFIVIGVVNYFTGKLAEPETTHTEAVRATARLTRYNSGEFAGSAANASLWVSMAMAAAATYVLARTRLGYEMRAVGLSAPAAEYGGVRVRWIMALTLLLSGAMAGLGGINFVLGNKGYFEKEFSAGVGFMGIAVALLARNQPIAVIPAAFLFATLSEGAVAIGTVVPGEIFDILMAIIILFVVVGAELLERARQAWQKRRTAEAARA